MNLLISACLMGIKCRYDGGRKPLDCLDRLMDQHVLIPICPEVVGGLPTPRVPAERIGEKVITSKYSGTEVKCDGQEYIIVRQSDILAVVE